MTELRSLTPTKLAASLAASHVPSDKTITETPTALAAAKSFTLPLICNRTGITVGSINVATVAGHMPMISQWKETMVLHPLFSLTPAALLSFSRNTWFRFCNFSIDEGADEQLTAKQEQTLQVAALAMLYNLANIRQDIIWMPEWQDVAQHWPSLMALSWWKAFNDSARFRFPEIHISRIDGGLDFNSYLQSCWKVKKDYETRVSERIELERLKAAETAMIALRDELAGAVPSSNKQVWRWFCAMLPKRYKKDTETWMQEVFFAKGEEIRQFTLRDIDLLEEIFLCEVPTGSSISHAFSSILASKRKYLEQHIETFEIMVPDSIIAAKEAGEISAVEPKLHDFPKRHLFLIAHARWELAHTDVAAKMEAAAERQKLLTVKPSHQPTLVIRENEEQEDDEEEDVVLDAFEEAVANERGQTAGEIEE